MSFSESPLGKIATLPIKWLHDLAKFRKTEAAIRNGEELARLDNDQIAQRGLLKPWTFNILEQVYATTPAIILVVMLNFIYGDPDGMLTITAEPGSRDYIRTDTYLSISRFLGKFSVPVITTLFVTLISWGSIKKKDHTPEKRAFAAKCYLYYDGAYGLAPQMFSVLIISVYVWLSEKPDLMASVWALVPLMGILFFFSVLIGASIIFQYIPERLFPQLGYAPKAVKGAHKPSDLEPPPSRKYYFAIFIGGWPLILAWLIFVKLFSISLAYLVTEIKLFVQ